MTKFDSDKCGWCGEMFAADDELCWWHDGSNEVFCSEACSGDHEAALRGVEA